MSQQTPKYNSFMCFCCHWHKAINDIRQRLHRQLLVLSVVQIHYSDDYGNHNMQGGVDTGTLESSCLTGNHEELRIVSVHGRGEGPLQEASDTLFTASELQAFSSLSPEHNVTHDSLLNFTTGATDRAPMRVMQDNSVGLASTALKIPVAVADDHVGHPSHVGQFPQQQNVFPHTVNKSLDCSFCGERFLSREDLIVHRATHTGESPIPCSYCGKSFVNKTTLTIHMRIHTGEKPYACMQCGKRFTQNGSLKIHLRTHSGEKPYTCNQCTASFNNPSNLRRHMITHTNGHECTDPTNEPTGLKRRGRNLTGKVQKNPLKSKREERKIETTESKSTEQETVENRGEKRYSCRFCHKVFDTQFGRSVHVRSHKKCRGCKKEFPFPSVLRCHKPFCAKLKKLLEKKFPCNLCNKKFHSRCRLGDHMRVHTGEKPFPCSMCPKKFRINQSLKLHILRIHKDQVNSSETNGDLAWTKPLEVIEDNREDLISSSKDPAHAINHNKVHKERNPDRKLGQKWQTMGKRCSDGYMCLLCQKVMKHKYLLTEHFRIHTGEKPFKCDRCPAKFRSYGQLKVHKKKCGKPMIQCEKCEKKFPTQMRHDKHVSKYHRDWSHFCKVCGKGFFMEGRLRNHMERHQ
uniref:C2H2-type domain-containing protein n=1 Tax=Dicentrarchus labrax TaxID=13489 RepID=A0A8P4KA80_DICLA